MFDVYPQASHVLSAFLRDTLGIGGAAGVELSSEKDVPKERLPFYDRQRDKKSAVDVVILDLSLLAAEVLENVTALIGRLILEFLQRLGRCLIAAKNARDFRYPRPHPVARRGQSREVNGPQRPALFAEQPSRFKPVHQPLEQRGALRRIQTVAEAENRDAVPANPLFDGREAAGILGPAERLTGGGIPDDHVVTAVLQDLLDRADAQRVRLDRRPDEAETISLRR